MKNFKELHESVISKSVATYLTYKFIMLMKEKFTNWEAYKLGIINDKGQVINKPKTKEEKEALGPIINLVRKVKRIMVKYVGDSKLLGLLITAYLMKSEKYERFVFDEEINKVLSEEEQQTLLSYLESSLELEKQN